VAAWFGLGIGVKVGGDVVAATFARKAGREVQKKGDTYYSGVQFFGGCA
jgi:hypothetical protein